MNSKFQFFPLAPVTPQAMSEMPCPSRFPFPVTVTELSLLSWGLSAPSGVTTGSCPRFGSSLVTPAVFPSSDIVKDPSLCPCQGFPRNFPSQGCSDPTDLPMVTALVPSPVLLRAGEHPSATFILGERNPVSCETSPFYTCLLPLETHEVLKPAPLQGEPGVCPGCHFLY